ncbi:hypothetical protein Tco_0419183 [Tanacetum coccineum]
MLIREASKIIRIIMANLLPPDHIADLPEVEPAQPELAPEVPELAPPVPDHEIEDPEEDPEMRIQPNK